MSATSSPPATPPLTSSTAGAGLDLVGGQGLDELGVARLDRLGDLLARPVDRFTHQQHLQQPPRRLPGTDVCRVYANASRGEKRERRRDRRARAAASNRAAGRRATAAGRRATVAAPRARRRARAGVPRALADAPVADNAHVVTAREDTLEELREPLPRGTGHDEHGHRLVEPSRPYAGCTRLGRRRRLRLVDGWTGRAGGATQRQRDAARPRE